MTFQSLQFSRIKDMQTTPPHFLNASTMASTMATKTHEAKRQ